MIFHSVLIPAARQIATLCTIWMAVSIAISGESESVPPDSKFEVLKLKHEVELEKLATPKPDLEHQYREQLGALRAKFTKLGDLEAVVLIRDEMKNLGAARTDDLPELQRLQRIYLEELDKRKLVMDGKRLSIYEEYRKALRELTVALTKDGDIAGAVASDAEEKRVADVIRRLTVTIENPGFIGHTYRRISPKRSSNSASKMVFHTDGTASESWTSGGREKLQPWGWVAEADGKIFIFKGKSKAAYSNPISWTFNSDFDSADVYSPFHKTTKKATRE